ncbi:HpcH/HpaI aldolase/citrate lyase family protein [Kitasatospora arboriphila]
MTAPETRRHPLFDGWPPLARRTGPDGPSLGLFLLSGSSMVAELCGTLPLDFTVLDLEASPMSKGDLLPMLQALTGSSCAPLVRVPYLHRHHIEHALDLGAASVMVPKVDTVEEARAAADACRYPPFGTRGVNPARASGWFHDLPGYLADAAKRTTCLVQIESPEAVAAADAIAAVPGVDGLFVGTGDLACSLGQPGVVSGPAMDRARAAVLAAARRHGQLAGIFAGGPEQARQYAAEGFDLIAVGNELALLRETLRHALDGLRGA